MNVGVSPRFVSHDDRKRSLLNQNCLGGLEAQRINGGTLLPSIHYSHIINCSTHFPSHIIRNHYLPSHIICNHYFPTNRPFHFDCQIISFSLIHG